MLRRDSERGQQIVEESRGDLACRARWIQHPLAQRDLERSSALIGPLQASIPGNPKRCAQGQVTRRGPNPDRAGHRFHHPSSGNRAKIRKVAGANLRGETGTEEHSPPGRCPNPASTDNRTQKENIFITVFSQCSPRLFFSCLFWIFGCHLRKLFDMEKPLLNE